MTPGHSAGFGTRRRDARGARKASRAGNRPGLQALEGRELLATFSVTNLLDAGAGSLRQAIVAANEAPGPDTIDFQVSGTVRVGRTPLPAVTDRLKIDGTTAPSFAGAPAVTVDYQGTDGLHFDHGADGSSLLSLSLVGAGGAGVTLSASNVTVQGNYIGLLADGSTAAGNRGDGVRINPSSRGNLIGNSNPVESISYYNADSVGLQPVSGWQGIRPGTTAGEYYVTGTSGSDGLLYVGPINGAGGTSYSVNVPGAATTSVYGPDLLPGGRLRLVGSYRTGGGEVAGFLWEGTTADLPSGGSFRTISYPGAQYNYVHSTMGGLAVGNADGPEGNAPIGTGHAFLYDVARDVLLPDIVYPGSTTTTAYGIWHNGGTSYTICGGYSAPNGPGNPIGSAYLVDYDSLTGVYSNWTSFDYPNGLLGRDFVTHFEGISSVEKGVYTLSADSVEVGSANPAQGSWVSVRRATAGGFETPTWVDLNYPGTAGITSSNSVAGDQVVGIVIGDSGTFSYQLTVNIGFQLSNVIGGNGGNGVGVYGSHDNTIAMNFIGTDAAGTAARGNGRNGVLVTGGAARNLIGGQATGGNDPTGGVFARPPQGNLISGNRANGVLVSDGATGTVLSGNFVGTAASGNSALGNALDGVAIVNADRNFVIGCTFPQDPFVFYNVLSGNGGSGLRVTDSDDVTVHANFMGAGADNATVVPNQYDGLLVSGSSADTQVGGVIPLGNVISGNDRHGIEVRDRATGFVSFNTFAGTFAFGGAAPNRLNGIMVTSTGGNNLIRTSIVSGNLGHGIEIGGHATGVQVTDTAFGTNSSIQSAVPNGGDGIRISGHARRNAIGGFQPSIEPRVTTSANGGYGVAIVGRARNNYVFNTYVGTNTSGQTDLGNGRGGVLLGPGTAFNTVGGEGPSFRNKILYSRGPGITLRRTHGNVLVGNEVSLNAGDGVSVNDSWNNRIGSRFVGNTVTRNGGNGLSLAGHSRGTRALNNDLDGNAGSGVFLNAARHVRVVGNRAAGNAGYGLFAVGDNPGTVVRGNAFLANAQGNVNLSQSRGVRYVP